MESLLSVPKELTQIERERIFEHYKSLGINVTAYTNHFDLNLPGRPPLFVKYGADVLAQASTQAFFYALAQSQKDPSAPTIPKIYDAFRSEKGYRFFVMEKIPFPTLTDCNISKDDAVETVTPAIKWLFAQLPSVPTSMFGRISSEQQACVWHQFFKDHEAPVPFANADALTKYVRKAYSRLPRKPQSSIHFSDDLVIYHADIRTDNFLHDINTGKTWIVDFQHIGVLPQPFQSSAFFSTGNPLAAAVGRRLGYQPSDINVAKEMAMASGLLWQSGGNASLGLDRFGESAAIKRKPESLVG